MKAGEASSRCGGGGGQTAAEGRARISTSRPCAAVAGRPAQPQAFPRLARPSPAPCAPDGTKNTAVQGWQARSRHVTSCARSLSSAKKIGTHSSTPRPPTPPPLPAGPGLGAGGHAGGHGTGLDRFEGVAARSGPGRATATAQHWPGWATGVAFLSFARRGCAASNRGQRVYAPCGVSPCARWERGLPAVRLCVPEKKNMVFSSCFLLFSHFTTIHHLPSLSPSLSLTGTPQRCTLTHSHSLTHAHSRTAHPLSLSFSLSKPVRPGFTTGTTGPLRRSLPGRVFEDGLKQLGATEGVGQGEVAFGRACLVLELGGPFAGKGFFAWRMCA